MFARVTFLPSLAFNCLLERLGTRVWWSRIDDSVVLGALPFRGRHAKQIVESEKVKAVVSMNEDYELKAFSLAAPGWDALGVKFLQLPTTDFFEVPSPDKLRSGVRFIQDVTRQHPDGTVYVHCKAGRTRSATLVACYLMQAYGHTPREAVDLLQEKRPQVLLGPRQWQALRDFHRDVLSAKGLS